LSASSLPRMPTWAFTHSKTTVFFIPSQFRVSLVSLDVLLVMSVESSVLSVAWLSIWKTIRFPEGSLVIRALAAALTAITSD
jgi:hypothetical protein